MSAVRYFASLMAQAEGRGVDLITLRALVEESSQAGARRALASLGLDDERARRDMDELRELLSAWREAKQTAWRAIVTWMVRMRSAVGKSQIPQIVGILAAEKCGFLATVQWHSPPCAATGALIMCSGGSISERM